MCTKNTIHGSLHKILYKGIYISFTHNWASLVTQMVKKKKKTPAVQETQVWFLGWGDPLEKGMVPTPVFLSEESHRQRSLVPYKPWDCKESEWLSKQTHTSAYSKFPKIGNNPDVLKLVDIWRKCDIWYKWIVLINRKKLVYLSVHGILQASILEWVATPFSRGSSQFRDQTWVSCTAGRLYCLTHQGSPGININLMQHQQ